MTHTIWTVGHSTRALEQFIGLITSHGIEAIADVRRFPMSRRYPHFNAETLRIALASRDIDYVSITTLGGRRRPEPASVNTGWRNAGFRGYADHTASEEFAEGLLELLSLSYAVRTAVMCAEAVWWRCHRALISDVLCSLGINVLHITTETNVREHVLTPPARVVEGQLTYAAPADLTTELALS
jgi:uncharacterized protein (DUF488 family)